MSNKTKKYMLCDEPNQTKPKYLVVAISTSTWMPIQSYQAKSVLSCRDTVLGSLTTSMHDMMPFGYAPQH